MSTYRTNLPQMSADVFLTDGGIETTLIFDDGLDLPDFAAFILLDDAVGREALVRYFDSYAAIAVRDRCRRRPRDCRRGGPTPTGRHGAATASNSSTPPTATPSSCSARHGGGTRRPTARS